MPEEPFGEPIFSSPFSGGTPVPPTPSFLLNEDDSFLLQEDGSKIIL
jgi:hypothetical protein